jgi:NADP-dependent 3-hydroxy acid dehydrogenase YdfG
VGTGLIKADNFETDLQDVQEMKEEPKLRGEDVADSVLYVLSTAPNVQVRTRLFTISGS